MKGTRTYCTVNTTKKKNVNVNLNTYDTKKGKTRSQVEKQWDDAKFSSLGIQKIKHFFPYFYQFYSSLFCHSNVFRSVKNELLSNTWNTFASMHRYYQAHALPFSNNWTELCKSLSFKWGERKKAKVIGLGKRLDSKLLCVCS